MAETTQSLNMTISEDLMTEVGNVPKTSPSKTEHVLGLENIQIQIPENVGTTSNSESARERNNT